MGFGVILPSPRIETFIFHYFQILNPKGKVANEYGAYRKQDGVTERALFVIDENGIIRWSHPIGVNPGADGILKALESDL